MEQPLAGIKSEIAEQSATDVHQLAWTARPAVTCMRLIFGQHKLHVIEQAAIPWHKANVKWNWGKIMLVFIAGNNYDQTSCADLHGVDVLTRK